MNQNPKIQRIAYGTILALLMAITQAQASFTTPLVVAVDQPTHNEFGQVLQGTAAQPGDLVQVLVADTTISSNGLVHPPQINGIPHLGNPQLGSTAGIGAGAVPGTLQPGIFAHVLNRTQDGNLEGQKIFIRVFNAPTLEEASFYADSEIFTVKGNDTFITKISATTLPLDPSDDDGDGLNNSWEKSYGTDTGLADTDHDGMSDWVEINQGTDPNAPVKIRELAQDGNDILIVIDTMVGGRYVIEQCSGTLVGSPEFTPVTETMTATSDTTVCRLENALDTADRCYFRAVQILD